jgi:hypothetical protein
LVGFEDDGVVGSVEFDCVGLAVGQFGVVFIEIGWNER